MESLTRRYPTNEELPGCWDLIRPYNEASAQQDSELKLFLLLRAAAELAAENLRVENSGDSRFLLRFRFYQLLSAKEGGPEPAILCRHPGPRLFTGKGSLTACATAVPWLMLVEGAAGWHGPGLQSPFGMKEMPNSHFGTSAWKCQNQIRCWQPPTGGGSHGALKLPLRNMEEQLGFLYLSNAAFTFLRILRSGNWRPMTRSFLIRPTGPRRIPSCLRLAVHRHQHYGAPCPGTASGWKAGKSVLAGCEGLHHPAPGVPPAPRCWKQTGLPELAGWSAAA